jgi:hypothetical protein
MTSSGRKEGAQAPTIGDEVLVAALTAGASYADAAQAGGVSVRTVSRRMADPEFRGRVRQERIAVAERVRARATDAALRAVETLDHLQINGTTEQVRLTAARALLQTAVAHRRGLLEQITHEDVARISGDLVEMAQRHMPDESYALFSRELAGYLQLAT